MKDAYFFSHDSNARTDPKVISMLLDHKAEGYGLYWCIIEILSEQDEYKLKKNKMTYNAIAMAMLSDVMAVENFVMAMLSDYELLLTDGEYFWSDSLIKRMEKKEQNRKKRSDAGKKGAESRWNNGNNNGNAMAIASDVIATASGIMANDGKGKKGEEIKESIESKGEDKVASNNATETLSTLPNSKLIIKCPTCELGDAECFLKTFRTDATECGSYKPKN